ncbi:MAG TPA: 4'-phosphopantetheinyl transferase superfamily protein [Rudaea sp.]
MEFLGPGDFAETAQAPPLGDDIHLWLLPWSRLEGKTAESPAVRARLADYLGTTSDALRIDYDVHGKPRIIGHALEFNASHSADRLLIAVSRGQPLGVDIETNRRERPWIELARRFFTPDETAALQSAAPAAQRGIFLALWSCKEAVLKAHGTGIRFGLQRVEFSLDDRGAVAALRAIGAEAGQAAQWNVIGLAPDTGSVGALAWHGPARRVRAFTPARAQSGYAKT